MITDFHVVGEIGVIKTKKEFVLIIKDKIFGPFKNEHVRKIVEVLEQNEGGKFNG